MVDLIDKLKLDENLLKHCKIQLLSLEEIVNLKTKISWPLEVKINIEYDLNYDKLYHGPWNFVPVQQRRMFQVLSFLKAYCIVRDPDKTDLNRLKKALYVLDVAIVVGAGLEESQLLTEFAQLLHDFLGKLVVYFFQTYLIKMHVFSQSQITQSFQSKKPL